MAYLFGKSMHLKKSAAAYPIFKELAKKEAYGIPYNTFQVYLRIDGDKATALDMQIAKKRH